MLLKKLLFALLLALPIAVAAQAPLNGGFEDTTIVSNDTVPRHWSADFFGFAFTTDAHSGSMAAQVWNWYSYARGWISYGNTTSPYSDGGLPITFNPDRLTGWYKYIYGDNGGAADSAVCEIMLYSHQNFTGARDTIAHVTHHFGPVAEYTPFDIPITYSMTGIPADTVVIRFLSSVAGFCNPSMECLYLTLDDLMLSGPTGVQPLLPEPAATAWPSPSGDGFRLKDVATSAWPLQVLLHDATGRLVLQTQLRSESDRVDAQALPDGAYHWKAVGHGGSLLQGTWLKQR